MLVDVHAHHSPRTYTEAMARLAGVERPRRWCAGLVALPLPHVDAALLCAWKAFGADHLVPGSDWPAPA